MLRFLLLTSLLALGVVAVFSIGVKQNKQSASASAMLSVIAFYNLENFYDTLDDPLTNDNDFLPSGIKQYGTAIFEHKVQQLASVLSGIGPLSNTAPPNIIGVAEIENRRVLEILCRHPLLQKQRYGIIHYNSPDPRGVDVALLYNEKNIRILYSKAIPVALPGGSKEARFTRDILYVKAMLGGDTLHLFVNHWPSKRGGEVRSAPARMVAAVTCRKLLDSIREKDSGAKMIVMGDFNDNPNSGSIKNKLGASGNREKMNSVQLYNPWLRWYMHGLGTLANRDHWSLFDQILISAPLLDSSRRGWFFAGEGIYQQPFMRENQGRYRGYPMRTWEGNRYRGGFSDHFPTYILLRKKY
ncbi:MAG: endonuclease/exonuclease/phosphatase [Chitinophagia bacterium]|nr:endonuclease/exonuclease/phosphatase [Chitinophagia bacterium]